MSDTPSVLVTGASRGLGLALARAFLSAGWRVYALIRNHTDAKKICDSSDKKCTVIIGDVTDNQVTGSLQRALASKGRLDVLINNAGIGGSGKTIATTTAQEIEELFAVHCLGALRITKVVWRFLSPDATIINVSSRFGSITKTAAGELDGIECSYAYRVAKAAQNMLTQCISKELKGTGQKLCAIHPGRLRTETSSADADRDPDEAADKLIELLPEFENGKYYSLFEGELPW